MPNKRIAKPGDGPKTKRRTGLMPGSAELERRRGNKLIRNEKAKVATEKRRKVEAATRARARARKASVKAQYKKIVRNRKK